MISPETRSSEKLKSSKDRTTKKPDSEKVAQIHNFASKLLQPELIDSLKEYVRWQVEMRNAEDPKKLFGQIPDYAPVSINLDLTTACNYACDHCVDMDILNKGIRFNYQKLEDSIDLMWKKGLKSVIIIGGGEPTVDRNFVNMVRFLKERKIQVAVVTNGSGMKKILEVAHVFRKGDWVRLSLDSGSNETFQAMHKPRTRITLEDICAGVPPVAKINPDLQLGFSFIVTWKGAEINNNQIIENIHEIYQAAKLARDSHFSYMSIKPFLERSFENNAEVVGISTEEKNYLETIKKIRDEVKKAKELETEKFKVVESTNLRALESGNYESYTEQPKNCHFTFFRQVLSPLGLFNCPVYRHVDMAKLGGNESYSDKTNFEETKEKMAEIIHEFDASKNCKKVTCLYNSANWFIEDLIKNPDKLKYLEPNMGKSDFYL